MNASSTVRVPVCFEFRRRCRSPAPCRRSWRRANRSARPLPYTRSRRRCSCRGGASGSARCSSQNWRRDSGSTPVVGSSRIRRSGSWISAAAEAELLPHPARQFLRRAIGERREPGAGEKLSDARLPLGTGLPEQAAEEFDVLAHAEIGIEVLAEALRHIGDARSTRRRGARNPPCRRRGRRPSRIGSAERRQRCSATTTCRRRRARSARPGSRREARA